MQIGVSRVPGKIVCETRLWKGGGGEMIQQRRIYEAVQGSRSRQGGRRKQEKEEILSKVGLQVGSYIPDQVGRSSLNDVRKVGEGL